RRQSPGSRGDARRLGSGIVAVERAVDSLQRGHDLFATNRLLHAIPAMVPGVELESHELGEELVALRDEPLAFGDSRRLVFWALRGKPGAQNDDSERKRQSGPTRRAAVMRKAAQVHFERLPRAQRRPGCADIDLAALVEFLLVGNLRRLHVRVTDPLYQEPHL